MRGMEEGPTYSLIDSTTTLGRVLDDLVSLPTDPPSLYLDLEGVDLSRKGTISLVTMLIVPKNHVYIIDVLQLQASAFKTAGSKGMTLTGILESPSIPKVFFDVRNDSDAMYHWYGVALQGVQDVQLMETASRPGSFRRKRYLAGLLKCIERNPHLDPAVKTAWSATKTNITALFNATSPGPTHVFDKRPLDGEALQYCINDVWLLPHLRSLYWEQLNWVWKGLVEREAKERVSMSQSASYNPHGWDKALGPWQETLIF